MKAKSRTMSMYTDEESDEGTVPMKRSNNGSLLPAEIVEGRASPKENGGQATAVRTPSRGTASSRLEAVRQAARQDKKVRFTALLLHITVDLLKQSYNALKRDAAPGTDGVTWQAYGENLDEKLKALHDRIHKGSYPGLFRCNVPLMDSPLSQAPDRGQAHPSPRGEVAESRCCRGWTRNTQ
jgi:hypothetical protein